MTATEVAALGGAFASFLRVFSAVFRIAGLWKTLERTVGDCWVRLVEKALNRSH